MSIVRYPLNLLSNQLSDYDISKHFAEVNFNLEKYLLEIGFHSINEVPHNSEPLDDKTLDKEFVWLPYSESNARILVLLPLPDENSKIFKKYNTRLLLTYNKEIIGIARAIGMDFDYEYYQFDFGSDLVPSGSLIHYDNKKVKITDPSKRLGNGIKERFLAEGGAGLSLSGGGGSSTPSNPLPGAPVGFLWKPSSESDGRLVVLFNGIGNDYAIVNGESGRFAGDQHNGNRSHFRFSKPGAGYPNDTVISTSVGTFTIPFPALRYEGTS